MPQSPVSPLPVRWLTEAFFPPLVGGQELIASYLAQGLAARGLKVEVITRQTVPASPRRETLGDVQVRRIEPAGLLKGKGWRAIAPLIGFLLRLSWMLIAEAPSYRVVIVSGVKIMPLVVVPLAALLGKKCILRAESYFELHEMISTESLERMGSQRDRLTFRMLETLRSFMLRRATAIVSISEQIRGELLQRGVPAERIVSIPNGISLKKFSPCTPEERRALRARLGIPQNRTIALYSGRLSRAKGVPLLIEAWPALLADHPDLFLVIVGSGHRSFDDCERPIKERVQNSAWANDVRFFDETDRVVDYLRAADFWVFPTEYEGFSLALAEAMACGLPVIATAVGAAPQLIEDGVSGFLIPPQDTAALEAGLRRALRERANWDAIGAAARRAVAPFDLELIAERYAELCRSVATHARA